MSSGKGGGKDGDGKDRSAISKAAGAVLATGTAWLIFRHVKARKAEQALIQEYYGDREDFVLPEGSDEDYPNFHDATSHVDAIVKEISSTEIRKDTVKKTEAFEVKQDVESKHEFDSKNEDDIEIKPKNEGKPWFLSFLDFLNLQKPNPNKDTVVAATEKPKPKDAVPKVEGKSDFYEIKKGDTLWELSGKYGVPVDSLKVANGIDGDLIYAGEKLIIPRR